jgi:FlaG/FlaF family flagellin (archaellin)
MVLVLAIIVILAAVVGMSIHGFVSKSNDASSSLASDRVEFRSNNAASNSAFVDAGF